MRLGDDCSVSCDEKLSGGHGGRLVLDGAVRTQRLRAERSKISQCLRHHHFTIEQLFHPLISLAGSLWFASIVQRSLAGLFPLVLALSSSDVLPREVRPSQPTQTHQPHPPCHSKEITVKTIWLCSCTLACSLLL